MGIKLNPVKSGQNRYCGPAAISILTGMDTDEAARLIRHINERRYIKSSGDADVLKALEMCNIKGTRITSEEKKPMNQRITLKAWLDDNRDLLQCCKDSAFLVSAGWHWQVVQQDNFVCGLTKKIVGFTHEKVRQKCRLHAVYQLRSSGVIIPQEAQKPKPHPLRRKARALASYYSIEIEEEWHADEREGATYSVWPPEGMFSDEGDDPRDPFCGERMTHDWGEIYAMVKQYADFAKHGVPAE